MERILEVKNLRISFRTNNGTVKAVRDIDFTLNRGETLAIVGESGSGKSVTARAVMGIQAGNSITESGEIFYDGKDLTKISEADFQQIRGNRISMVFQDPFSSLNPIVRIGKQLTEAMILNSKINRRDAKRSFSKRLRLLEININRAKGDGSKGKLVSALRKFSLKGSKLEKPYAAARNNIIAAAASIDGVLIDIIRGEPKAVVRDIRRIVKLAGKCGHKYLIRDGRLDDALASLKTACNAYLSGAGGEQGKEGVKGSLSRVREALAEALELPAPDFFAMGYMHGKTAFDDSDIGEMNDFLRKHLNDGFLNAFINDASRGIKFSHQQSLEKKRLAVNGIASKMPLFENPAAESSVLKNAAKELIKAVEASIDELALQKDSFAYTFKTGLNAELGKYIRAREVKAKKYLSRREREFAERADVELYRDNVLTVLTRIKDAYNACLDRAEETDYPALARGTAERIKSNASQMVYRVTKRMAKSRAIGLMEEVGIPEARARYSQYPFQFSGGMRQRIVIAIALAANPDILICDEPSTALDVTIQAQILDLINNLKETRGLSVIFITHDLGVVANIADKLAVMYAGKIVEYGTADDVFFEPAHPYTWALLASMPDLDTKEKLEAIPGAPPNMIHPPEGDAFAVRNKYALEIDFEQEPPFFEISPTHKAAAWLLHPDAPKAEPPRIVTERIERMRRMELEEAHG